MIDSTKKLSRSCISMVYDYKLGCSKKTRCIKLLDDYTLLYYKKFLVNNIKTSRKIKSSFYDLNLRML